MIFIIILILGLLLIVTGVCGIYFSRKNKAIKFFLSKKNTLIFVSILSFVTFSFEIKSGKDFFNSIGYTFGYVILLTYPTAALASFFMNKFKFNKEELWSAWFVILIWILIIMYRDYFI
jgi:hypothetical protein